MKEEHTPREDAGPDTSSKEIPPGDRGARLSRRRFLSYLLGLTGAIGLGGLAAPIVRYAYPVEETQAAPRQEVGSISGLTPLEDAIEFDYQETPAALILSGDGEPIAVSRVCTHFGCIVDWTPEDEIFYCPCHAGVFSPEGEVLSGPPPRPLPRLQVTVEADTAFVEGWAES